MANPIRNWIYTTKSNTIHRPKPFVWGSSPGDQAAWGKTNTLHSAGSWTQGRFNLGGTVPLSELVPDHSFGVIYQLKSLLKNTYNVFPVNFFKPNLGSSPLRHQSSTIWLRPRMGWSWHVMTDPMSESLLRPICLSCSNFEHPIWTIPILTRQWLGYKLWAIGRG